MTLTPGRQAPTIAARKQYQVLGFQLIGMHRLGVRGLGCRVGLSRRAGRPGLSRCAERLWLAPAT